MFASHTIATPATCPYKGTAMHEEARCHVCDHGLDICLKCGKAEGQLDEECKREERDK